jgi:hypothetical protein
VTIGVDCRGEARAGWLTADEAHIAELLTRDCACFAVVQPPIGQARWVTRALPRVRRLESGRIVVPQVRATLFEAASQRIGRPELLGSCCIEQPQSG